MHECHSRKNCVAAAGRGKGDLPTDFVAPNLKTYKKERKEQEGSERTRLTLPGVVPAMPGIKVLHTFEVHIVHVLLGFSAPG